MHTPLEAQALATYKRALGFHGKGQLAEAHALYVEVLQAVPRHADAMHMVGLIAAQTGDFERAAALIGNAIAINPTDEEYFYNRGKVFDLLRQFEASVEHYEKAIAIKPDYADAYYNCGIALAELQRFEASLASYDKAIAIAPTYMLAHNNRGIVAEKLELFEAAVASYDQALKLDPAYASAYINRGIALAKLNQFRAAVESFDKAIAIQPDRAETYASRGAVLVLLKQFEAAVESFDNAIKIKPDYAEAYASRGTALVKLKQPEAAVQSYEQASSLEPQGDYFQGALLHTKMQLCDWSNLEGNSASLFARIERREKATIPFPVLALTASLSLQRASAEIWCQDQHPINHSLGPLPRRTRSKKIRIGYYSADFHNHATSYLMAELFELHDRSAFELIAFSFGPDIKDEMRQRVSGAFDRFIEVGHQSDKSIAALSRDMGIDIAVDLKGCTEDGRVGIFSYRTAPVQVSYIGYPGTTGAEYMDYLIADKVLIPEQSRHFYSEKIAYLPNSYQVNDRKRKISDRPFSRQELGLPETGFVYCCFNNSYKITPETFDVWMRILTSVSNSVLWLLAVNPTAAINLRREAERRGIDPARLVFAHKVPTDEHLARLRVADLFIDTLPCNAHTTASDALWAGLPVLTCTAEAFASRVAASLLHAMDLSELVTDSQSDYERLAVELGTDQATLQALKKKLAISRQAAPLFDTTLYVTHLESAYQQMYERYHANEVPDHLYAG